jgi:hypothetical protein
MINSHLSINPASDIAPNGCANGTIMLPSPSHTSRPKRYKESTETVMQFKLPQDDRLTTIPVGEDECDMHEPKPSASGDICIEEHGRGVELDAVEDPRNMSRLRRKALVIATGLMTFCVVFGSSVFTATFAATSEEFDVSSEVMVLGLSLYVLGFAFGKTDKLSHLPSRRCRRITPY